MNRMLVAGLIYEYRDSRVSCRVGLMKDLRAETGASVSGYRRSGGRLGTTIFSGQDADPGTAQGTNNEGSISIV